MSRIRTIKPDFFVDDQVMSLSRAARLLWIGMWCFCDDQGIHPDSARRLKAEVFPSDDCTVAEVQAWLDELVAVGLVVRFRCEKQQAFLAVPGFAKHQRIDRPTRKYPAPTLIQTNTPRPGDAPGSRIRASTSARRVIDEASTNARRALDHGMEGKGKEGKGEEDSAACASPTDAAAPDVEHLPVQEKGNGHDRGKRGSRLAADWQPSAEERAYCAGLGLDVDATAAEFRDYWIAVPGTRGRKLDWSATWRNRCREVASRQRHRAGPSRPASGGTIGAAARALARFKAGQDDPGDGRPV